MIGYALILDDSAPGKTIRVFHIENTDSLCYLTQDADRIECDKSAKQIHAYNLTLPNRISDLQTLLNKISHNTISVDFFDSGKAIFIPIEPHEEIFLSQHKAPKGLTLFPPEIL